MEFIPNTIQPACLPPMEEEKYNKDYARFFHIDGRRVKIIGWGRTNGTEEALKSKQQSCNLLEADVATEVR